MTKSSTSAQSSQLYMSGSNCRFGWTKFASSRSSESSLSNSGHFETNLFLLFHLRVPFLFFLSLFSIVPFFLFFLLILLVSFFFLLLLHIVQNLFHSLFLLVLFLYLFVFLIFVHDALQRRLHHRHFFIVFIVFTIFIVFIIIKY